MECKWLFTNIHEQKSYIIKDQTLVGIKNFCEIKLWGTDITENDIRFKVRGSEYISVKVLRKDLKKINFKIDFKPISDNSLSIHLRNNRYFSIESYIFKVTRVCVDKNLPKDELLQRITKKATKDFQNEQKNKKCDKVIAKVKPNAPSLIGKYVNGQMIFPNESDEWESIDLTS